MARKYSEREAMAIMKQNFLLPIVPYQNTQIAWKSTCLKCKREVAPRLQKVIARGHQCQYCSGHVVHVEDALRIMKSAGLIPMVAYPGANKPWNCKCKKCGKITKPSLTAVKIGIGCKFCSKRAVDPQDAENAMRKRGFEVQTSFPGATSPWKVKCLKCKRVFETKFHSLNTKSGCKYCSGTAVKEQDLIDRLKELKLKPLAPYVSAKTPWKCKCLVCGHTVQPTWNRIKQGRGHCAYCANRRVDQREALKILNKLKLKPLEPFPGSNRPWKCLCLECNEIVKPRWTGIRTGQRGCSNCADFGLNYTKPGYLYLIFNNELNSGKLGIGNSYKNKKYDDRLYKHSKNGWEQFQIIDFEKLYDAYKVEQKALMWLRKNVNIPIHLSSNQMPYGGWTETFNLNLIELKHVWERIEDLIRVEK